MPMNDHHLQDSVAAIGALASWLTGSMFIGALTVIYLVFGIALRWQELRQKWRDRKIKREAAK